MITIQSSMVVSTNRVRQRGVVLFFALVALVAMSLAAVALIRSVDTSTLIAGNLSFKQAATNSGDKGIEAAISWMAAVQAANPGLVVLNDPTHPFNLTCLATRSAGTNGSSDPGCTGIVPGYHSNIDSTLNLTDPATWNDVNSVLVTPPDASGYEARYIIQRACRTANKTVKDAGCLFGGIAEDPNPQMIVEYQKVCDGPGCPPPGQTPQNRITVQVSGPRNTVSYVQAFVF
ncbi:MAG: hypothetical protein PHF20_05775 [Halothiobacillaceae bacterium]|nr:hypothetical protein [Halothiobacillaceae bacterium]